MRRVLPLLVLGLFTSVPHAAAATCTATGFFRDGINMTAAVINPASVTGDVDATGCNIGVYVDGSTPVTIDGATISGANYFGVLANGDAADVAVTITNSTIRDIGESPHNGTQHGVAVYLRAFFADGSVTARVAANHIYGYQKGGIVANGVGTQATIDGNVVEGDGHVTFIAMNGIQVGYGASAAVMRNTVSGNSYVGYPGDGSASGGILVVGGPGYGVCPDGNACPYSTDVRIMNNTLSGNDVGVYLSNWNSGADPAPPVATNIKVVNNTIDDDACFNVAYQAGVSDVGNNDKIVTNTITGAGYASPCGTAIDAAGDFTARPKVHAND